MKIEQHEKLLERKMTTYNMCNKWTFLVEDEDQILCENTHTFSDTLSEIFRELNKLSEQTIDIYNDNTEEVEGKTKEHVEIRKLDWKYDVFANSYTSSCEELLWNKVTVFKKY